MARKTSTTRKKSSSKRASRRGYTPGQAAGKSLVIVESPSKAKTINKYLGPDYVVLASVGHVRDLPSKAKKGDKSPVPGVDLEHHFKPTYEILSGKEQIIRDLKKAAKEARDVWFATDLDREGEAIAWHLAEELGIDVDKAKRVVFAAITQSEIERAFSHPHAIDLDRVNAQQARRILDRIVGYQVSPLLWKKVARGLSAGRVQSVAVRLVVEREREIRAFIPDEYWQVQAKFALSEDLARSLVSQWADFCAQTDDKGNPPTIKQQNAWLSKHESIRAELVKVGGQDFDLRLSAEQWNKLDADDPAACDLTPRMRTIAALIGLTDIQTETTEDEQSRGPSRWKRTLAGRVDPSTPYRISSIETRRTSTRPPAPFITSTMQQAASSRLGFGAQRTMRAAQALYEGIDIPGEGPVGLITYMRTDSTHIAAEALASVRTHIERTYGKNYLPQKPNFFGNKNKQAQEAHEAIRPTSLEYPPARVKNALTSDQFKLYELIWKRFIACQMTPAEWDSTTFLIEGGTDPDTPVTFKATGRRLVFDGFYKVAGVPNSGEDIVLPDLRESQQLRPFALDVVQKFTSPPPRYTEASLIKTLESEGIGRPSTYASIIQVIQDRRYVEQINRAFYATDLGEVVTDKLVEAFPRLMDVGYTRQMEEKLDKIEEEHLDWIEMLEQFYARFSKSLDRAHEQMQHAKAETQPSQYDCPKCGSPLVYRFGKNGRFLSCSTYPKCTHASPVDRMGRPRAAEFVNIRCPKTGRPMVRRTGRFGPFVTTALEEGEDQSVGIILNIDKKGHVTAPSPPPIKTDIPCPKCSGDEDIDPDKINYLNLRDGVRGPWLGCSAFPKCRGRGKWSELPEEKRKALEKQLAEHLKAHPIPIIETLDGVPLTDARGRPLKDAPTVDQLVLDEDPMA
ncbi:MAG: type I DNA topoisomerase, partial [Planctomycetota bacterium]